MIVIETAPKLPEQSPHCSFCNKDQHDPKHAECGKDLIGPGFIPTLAARLGSVVAFDAPDRDDYESMLTRSGGLFEQYRGSFEKIGRHIQFRAECAGTIAAIAVTRNEGFLGLQTLMRQIGAAILAEEAPSARDALTTIEPQWVQRALQPWIYER